MTHPTLADSLEAGAVEMQAYDRTGRTIKVGDVLKVFHFTGARWRKKYFMYKHVHSVVTLGASKSPYFWVSHLDGKPDTIRENMPSGYLLALDGSRLGDTEIVQGYDWHHDRPRAHSTDGENSRG